MASHRLDIDMLRKLRATFAADLKEFASSSSTLRVLRSVPAAQQPQSSQAKTIYVLDSSFNPPSKAHLQLSTSALSDDKGAGPKRVLLLLATINADKAPKPALFEDRLVMMTLFAQELQGNEGSSCEAVDVGITKKPFFHDKAFVIDESKLYSRQPQQVHLTGFDTIVRIFNKKYYPPDHTFAPLEPFLSKHRLRVAYRTADEWGEREEQEQYLKDIAAGKRETEGAKREWTQQIELVEGLNNGGDVFSSTLARKAVHDDPKSLEKFVTPAVADWIRAEQLYLDE